MEKFLAAYLTTKESNVSFHIRKLFRLINWRTGNSPVIHWLGFCPFMGQEPRFDPWVGESPSPMVWPKINK